MMKTQSILQGEFIGLRVRILRSQNRDLVGISGKVVNETCNTFTIREKDKERIVPKNVSTLEFVFPDNKIIEVEGKSLQRRPEDRVKRVLRRIW